MYEERPPAPDLAARVACHWHHVSESSSTQLVVPDACVDLIWGPGGLFVAGPDTGPMPTEMTAGDVFVGVRFRPGAASDLFGVPLHTLRDQRIPLSDLPTATLLAPFTTPDPAAFTTPHPASSATSHPQPALQSEPTFPATRTAPDLATRHAALAAATCTLLTHLTTPGRSAALAGSTASTRLPDPAARLTNSARLPGCARLPDSARPADPAAPFIARALRLGRSVSEVARDLGLSERQLHRRSLTAFGYAPKTLQRIVRFQRALRLARAGIPLATVAAETGYADQAHLSHEVKRLSGVSLRTLAPPSPVPPPASSVLRHLA
ncbi:AraC family transcriptional regulator [Nonomuraea wenchangensis]